METEILADVSTYLGDEVGDTDKPFLLILIKQVVRKVCNKRYPFGYTDIQREKAIEKYRTEIFDGTIYRWAKDGAEGESSHNENGISRAYEKEDDIYFDVVPMAKTL